MSIHFFESLEQLFVLPVEFVSPEEGKGFVGGWIFHCQRWDGRGEERKRKTEQTEPPRIFLFYYIAQCICTCDVHDL